jgi:hypothetical protein
VILLLRETAVVAGAVLIIFMAAGEAFRSARQPGLAALTPHHPLRGPSKEDPNVQDLPSRDLPPEDLPREAFCDRCGATALGTRVQLEEFAAAHVCAAP